MSKFKIVLIGDSGVGKTSIFTRFDKDTFIEDPGMTIGGAFTRVDVNTQKGPIELGIWDTAGQERFRNVVPMYFQRAFMVLIVFDLTNEESFEHLDEWIEMSKDKSPPGCKFIIIGNKLDLINSRAVPFNAFQSVAQKHDALFTLETSAKTGEGIDILLQKIAEECVKTEISPDVVEQQPDFQDQSVPSSNSCSC